jgi:hypothetical protein
VSRWQSFAEGWRSRRPFPLIAGVALALTVVAGSETALRRLAFSRIPAERFNAWSHDLWSFLPHRLGKLAAEPSGPRVFLLGSSSLFHSFFGETGLRQTVRLLGGGAPPEIVTLHLPTQNFGETLALVDNLPRGGGLVLIATSALRFRDGRREIAAAARSGHLLLASPTLARFFESKGESGTRFRFALPAFVNYLRVYLPLNRSLLAEGKLPRWNLWPKREEPAQLADLARAGEPDTDFPPEAVPPYPPESLHHHLIERRENYREPAELLSLCIQRAKAKGYRVALLETPLNPDFRKRIAAKVAVLSALTRAIADGEGIESLDFTWRLGLAPSDFVDSVHLDRKRTGKARYHFALAREIVRLGAAKPTLLSSRAKREAR